MKVFLLFVCLFLSFALSELVLHYLAPELPRCIFKRKRNSVIVLVYFFRLYSLFSLNIVLLVHTFLISREGRIEDLGEAGSQSKESLGASFRASKLTG